MLVSRRDRQLAARGVEPGSQLRQLFVAHQHDEMGLREPFRVLRIEAGRRQRDREAPVVRQAFARQQRDPLQALGAQPLDRIAIDRGNRRRHRAASLARLARGEPRRRRL